MDRARLPDFGQRAAPRRLARFHLVGGLSFTCAMNRDCEQFVGRFARLPELKHADHVVRFETVDTADSTQS